MRFQARVAGSCRQAMVPIGQHQSTTGLSSEQGCTPVCSSRVLHCGISIQPMTAMGSIASEAGRTPVHVVPPYPESDSRPDARVAQGRHRQKIGIGLLALILSAQRTIEA
jgi:hypothetical protein